MRNLLLVSNSTMHGGDYLAHCQTAICELFAGRENLLFVPYALGERDEYAGRAATAFAEFGFSIESIHQAIDPVAAIAEAGGIFIGGGNTFRLMEELYQQGLVTAIRAAVLERGIPYLGTSAGSNVACKSICTTNDMPIVYPPTFDAIALVPFQINAHYLDPDPRSTHMGETRETRIREFHELHGTPVIGLREGAWLRIIGDHMTLGGTTGARLFQRGATAEEFPTGSDLSRLLRP